MDPNPRPLPAVYRKSTPCLVGTDPHAAARSAHPDPKPHQPAPATAETPKSPASVEPVAPVGVTEVDLDEVVIEVVDADRAPPPSVVSLPVSSNGETSIAFLERLAAGPSPGQRLLELAPAPPRARVIAKVAAMVALVTTGIVLGRMLVFAVI